MAALCAWCEAPKSSGPVCPQCGADYAKAEAIRRTGKAANPESRSQTFTTPDPEPEPEAETIAFPVSDPAWEKQMCLFALPGMLAIALLVQVTGFLAAMQRIVFAMPVHELGHAVTGWLCGFNAIPTVWKTLTPENRGFIAPVLLLTGLLALARYGLKRKQPLWLLAVLVVFVVQMYCTLGITLSKADMLITLGGDAMGLVLATLLMALFYVGKDTQLYKGSLRWGFLAIGAAAFMNMYVPWWNKDISAIGYGLTGGIPTDSWKMINIHLWSWESLFSLHIMLGMACLGILAVVYGIGLKQANGWVKAKTRQDRIKHLRHR